MDSAWTRLIGPSWPFKEQPTSQPTRKDAECSIDWLNLQIRHMLYVGLLLLQFTLLLMNSFISQTFIVVVVDNSRNLKAGGTPSWTRNRRKCCLTAFCSGWMPVCLRPLHSCGTSISCLLLMSLNFLFLCVPLKLRATNILLRATSKLYSAEERCSSNSKSSNYLSGTRTEFRGFKGAPRIKISF